MEKNRIFMFVMSIASIVAGGWAILGGIIFSITSSCVGCAASEGGLAGGGWIVALEMIGLIIAVAAGLVVLLGGIKGLKAARGHDSLDPCRKFAMLGIVGAGAWLVLRIIVAIIYGSMTYGYGVLAADLGSPITLLIVAIVYFVSIKVADRY